MFKHWYLKFVSVLSVFSFINMSLTVDARAFGYEPRLPENSFNRVYYLASQGQVSALRRAMERGLDINGVNEHGDAGICVAVRRQDRMAYDTFRAVGASLNPPCRGRIPYWDYFVDPEKARQLAAQRAAEARRIAEEQAAQRAAEEEAARKTAEAAKKTSDRKWGVWPWVLGAGAVGGIAIALASGGGGGGGSSHNDGGSQKPTPTPNKCENVSCPSNSSCHEGKCLCYEGYLSWNGLCYEPLDCGDNAHQEGDECYCDKGYHYDEAKDQCVPDPSCGDHGTWNGTACVCEEGYVTDESGKCVKKPTSDECGGYGHKVDGVCVCDDGYGLNGAGNCEPFQTSEDAFVISSEKIINNAKPLKNSGEGRAGVWGGIYTKNSMVINEGEILLEGGKHGVGILSCQSPTWECMTTQESLKTNSQLITNSGRITINADESVGIFASNLADNSGTFFTLTNHGDIKLKGTDNAGIVLYNKGKIENNGNITLEGTAKTSAGDNQWANTAIYFRNKALNSKQNIIVNNGDIKVNLKADADTDNVKIYGIYLDGSAGGLTNNGNIEVNLTDAKLYTGTLDAEALYPYHVTGLYSNGDVPGSGKGNGNMVKFSVILPLKEMPIKSELMQIVQRLITKKAR